MKTRLKTNLSLNVLCSVFLFTPISLKAMAPAWRTTVWNAVVSPEALIAVSIATAGYTGDPIGILSGSIGALAGSGWMAYHGAGWRKVAGIVGTALSGSAIGAQIWHYVLLNAALGPLLKIIASKY